ncbi:MAG TPA: hypothetical protein VFC84_14730 [Desulfosporosinus sp.]|nr:hypothetical protein [Desulfosporosinus sp.]
MGGTGVVMGQYKNRIYWANMAGSTNSAHLQTNMIIALRLQGFKGTLNDNLRAFFMKEFGIDDISEGTKIYL